jgi:hypothetical protein
MKIKLETCTIEELWKYVATELSAHGVDVVLVGGAVVSIYTSGAYESGDLDFVLYDLSRQKLDTVLGAMGFKRDGRYYKHPQCRHLFLEFSTFPATIGDDASIVPDEWEVEGKKIKIFGPTDSVRDRLASYIYFRARDCLDQAAMVASRHPVNFEKVKSWCKKEGAPSAFDDLMKKLKKA